MSYYSQKKSYLSIVLLTANLSIVGCLSLLINLLITKTNQLGSSFWIMLFISQMLFATFFYIKNKTVVEIQKHIFSCIFIIYAVNIIIYQHTIEIFLFWIIIIFISNSFWGTKTTKKVFIYTSLIYIAVPILIDLSPFSSPIKLTDSSQELKYVRSFMHLSTLGIIITLISIYNKRNEEVTMEKEEKIIQRFNEELQRKNTDHMENKTAAVFHDIKNLISIQSLCIETIDNMLKNQKESNKQKYLQVIKPALTATKRLTLLVDVNRDALLSRTQKSFFSPAKEVEAILEYHKPQLTKLKIKVVKKMNRHILINNCKSSFYRITDNLFSNAIDSFTKYDGRCKNQIQIILEAKEECLYLIISDNGCGINTMHLDKIYESHFSTKSPSNNSGIGLTITKHCVEQIYKGTISCTSNEGCGSTFTVLLPLS